MSLLFMSVQSIKNFEEWNELMAQKYNPDIYHRSRNPILRCIANLRVKAIIDFLNVQKNDEVIEIGCGAGNILERFNKGKLTGVDLSDFLLAIARNKLENKKVDLFKGDAENLPAEIKNKKFDKIICSEVLEHVQHPGQVINEILKIAHPNATIVISIPNEKLINFLKQVLLKLKIFSIFLPNVSKKMDEEWHLHNFDLKLLNDITRGKLEMVKIKPIFGRFFPLYYVVKFKICFIH